MQAIRRIALGLLGILLVVAGSWLLNFDATGRLSVASLFAPLKAIVINPGSRLMLMTATIYAVTSVGGKAAMQWMPAEQFGAFYFAVLGALVVLLAAIVGVGQSMYEMQRYVSANSLGAAVLLEEIVATIGVFARHLTDQESVIDYIERLEAY